jgi:DNA-binding SARP family transcriptional activator
LGLNVQLLGPPRLERGGVLVSPPRGYKAWALLVYLVRARVPPTRQHLAELLFSEADDPLGALRWTMSALRHKLGVDAELGGDPVRLTLARGTLVDVDVLSRGTWTQAVELRGFGQELLHGLAFRSSPGFELWLDNERRHVEGMTAAVRHHAALALLVRGEVKAATEHATDLVRLNPYDEHGHVLLVRCLRESGNPAAARRHVEAATAFFQRELGRDPTPALRGAAMEPTVRRDLRVSGRSEVLVQLEAAASALAAGATETGIQGMWRAVIDARGVGDRELMARSLVELGAALVHAGRGTDE